MRLPVANNQVANTQPRLVLPAWAQRCPEVVKLCEIDMEFRRNVLNATDPRYKRILIQKARQTVRNSVA